MILNDIQIERLGRIDFFSLALSPEVQIVKSRYSDELAYAIHLLCQTTPSPSPFGVREGARITANVMLEEKRFSLLAVPNAQCDHFTLSAYDEEGNDVTDAYLYLSAHCEEHDACDCFDGNERTCRLRFLFYAREDSFFTPKELSRKTNGMANVRAFRKYLSDFIKAFRPEEIREGKQYELYIDRNGLYGVRHTYSGDTDVCLSDSETRLFHFLCFLKSAEFWRGFEELRNLNGIRKPLIVQNFLEFLDESIDRSALLERTKKLKRQVILLAR